MRVRNLRTLPEKWSKSGLAGARVHVVQPTPFVCRFVLPQTVFLITLFQKGPWFLVFLWYCFHPLCPTENVFYHSLFCGTRAPARSDSFGSIYGVILGNRIREKFLYSWLSFALSSQGLLNYYISLIK